MAIHRSHTWRWLRIILCWSIVLLYFRECVYYLGHSRTALLENYLSGGCFYRQQSFIFGFNEQVKSQGNIFCLLAIPLLLLFVYGLRSCSVYNIIRRLWVQVKCNYRWLAVLLVICIVMAADGHRYNALCSDEAFSALNFAGAPLKRLLSHYPIPNNHIFFNLLNHFASEIYADPLVTARILSAVFYCILIAGNFLLLVHHTRSRALAFGCSVLLALQFLVWGFGHQGRGYALCYLMEWGSFVATYYYFFSSATCRKEALTVILLCNIIGTWTIPVFAYLLLFQVLVVIVLMLRRRQLYRAFWVMLLLSGVGIFLVYLPLLCYSGAASLVGNNHHPGTFAETLWSSWAYFYELVTLQSFGFLGGQKLLALGFFILPFLLFLLSGKIMSRYKGLLFLYAVLWLSVGLLTIATGQFPIMRGLGFQMQIGLLMVLLLSVTLVTHSGMGKLAALSLFAVVIPVCAVRMYHFNKDFSNTALYGQDTRSFLSGLEALPQGFKPADRIWLSDESFIWPFILKGNNPVDLYDCNFNNQELLFLSEDDRPLPDTVMHRYKERNRAGWFIIYERQ